MGGLVHIWQLAVMSCLFIFPATAAAQSLLGSWACEHQNTRHSLEFLSQSQLRFDGAISNYAIFMGQLVVEDEGGVASYGVQLAGDRLNITNPDGSITNCRRGVAAPPKGQPSSPAAPQARQGQQSWPRYAKPAPPPGGYTGNESDLPRLVWKFAGRWAYVTPNTLTNLILKPDGTFEEVYEGGYSGQFGDQYGNQTGNWGATGADQGTGQWWIEGTLRKGKIYLTSRNGSRRVLNYQVHVRRGVEYSGEYFFNGKLYSVKYIYR